MPGWHPTENRGAEFGAQQIGFLPFFPSFFSDTGRPHVSRSMRRRVRVMFLQAGVEGKAPPFFLPSFSPFSSFQVVAAASREKGRSRCPGRKTARSFFFPLPSRYRSRPGKGEMKRKTVRRAPRHHSSPFLSFPLRSPARGDSGEKEAKEDRKSF